MRGTSDEPVRRRLWHRPPAKDDRTGRERESFHADAKFSPEEIGHDLEDLKAFIEQRPA
jgi:hypothetical protein